MEAFGRSQKLPKYFKKIFKTLKVYVYNNKRMIEARMREVSIYRSKQKL